MSNDFNRKIAAKNMLVRKLTSRGLTGEEQEMLDKLRESINEDILHGHSIDANVNSMKAHHCRQPSQELVKQINTTPWQRGVLTIDKHDYRVNPYATPSSKKVAVPVVNIVYTDELLAVIMGCIE